MHSAQIPLPEISSKLLASNWTDRVDFFKFWTIPRDNGWVDEWATAIIICFSSSVSSFPKYSIPSKIPVVSVPVLSKTISVISFIRSITFEFLIYNPFRPKTRVIFPYVKGAEIANAQGHATIKMETTIWVIFPASINAHASPAPAEITKIADKN